MNNVIIVMTNNIDCRYHMTYSNDIEKIEEQIAQEVFRAYVEEYETELLSREDLDVFVTAYLIANRKDFDLPTEHLARLSEEIADAIDIYYECDLEFDV